MGRVAMIDAKAYFLQIRIHDTLINNKLEELERLKSLATKITTTMRHDAGVSGGVHDKVGEAVARIIETEEEINKIVDRYVKMKQNASGIVEQLNDPLQIQVLTMRYFGIWDQEAGSLRYPSWNEIADSIHCTYRHTTRIHGWALQKVAKILENQKMS